MLALKQVLQEQKISQAALARLVDLSPATIAELVNKEKWPTKPDKKTLQGLIVEALADQDIAVDAAVFKPVLAVDAEVPKTLEVITMLLDKQSLSQEAKEHFRVFKNPFEDDLNDCDDVFKSAGIVRVREWLESAAKFGVFGAIVGESGSGKTTLRMDFIERVNRENMKIRIIEPTIRRSEDNDKKGKTLKSSDIEDAIIYTLAPLESPRRSPEAKARQVERLLSESRRAGYANVLIMEEAHSLSIPTIKHLKRFYEIRDGFKKLLSIVMIGQTELKLKLKGQAGDVREVSQRCEVIELGPLDKQLEAYLRFKFAKVGATLEQVFDADALDGITDLLTLKQSNKTGSQSISYLYPLMVNNLVIAAMNHAESIGAPLVNADCIKGA